MNQRNKCMNAQKQQQEEAAMSLSVGIALHKIMKEKGLSPKRLGYYLRIPTSEMEKILDGSSHLPSFYISRLSKVTKTDESMWYEIINNDVFHPDSKKTEQNQTQSGFLSTILGFFPC